MKMKYAKFENLICNGCQRDTHKEGNKKLGKKTSDTWA